MTNNENIRVAPHSEEAEISVLGAVLQDREAIEKVSNHINPNSFYRDSSKFIFSAVMNLYTAGLPVDQTSVIEKLREWGKLDKVGGAYYITGLVESTPSAANAEYYAKIVKEKETLRKLIQWSHTIEDDAYSLNNSQEILNYLTGEVFSLQKGNRSPSRLITKEDILNKRKEGLITRIEGFTIGSGYERLDTHLSVAYSPKTLSIICGRPSHGKTALKENIIINQCKAGYGVLCITPEMGFDAEMDRMTSILTQIPLMEIIRIKEWAKVQDGNLYSEKAKEKLMRIKEATEIISSWNLHFLDGSLDFATIHRHALEMKSKYDIDIVYIDLFDRIKEISMAVNNKPSEVTKGLNYLTRVAEELEIHICNLVQLSRKVEYRKEKGRPLLGDLKDSGSFEEYVWTVFGVYREAVYDDSALDDSIDVMIMKQRQGPTKIIELGWNKDTITITDDVF